MEQHVLMIMSVAMHAHVLQATPELIANMVLTQIFLTLNDLIDF